MDPNERQGKLQNGTFDKIEADEEFEEEELDLDFAVPGVANTEMGEAAEKTRRKSGTKPMSADSLAALFSATDAIRQAWGDDEDEDDSTWRSQLSGDDDDEGQGSLDTPLWHGILAAPPPPPRTAGFPRPSKWVRPSQSVALSASA